MHHPYAAVGHGNSNEDLSDKLNQPTARKLSFDWYARRKSLSIGSLLAIIAIAGLVLFSLHPGYKDRRPAPPSSAHCGNSSAEAAAIGCAFDIMSFTWSRRACFDEELMLEFLAARNWTWWLTADGEQEVDMETVAWGIHSHLFVSWEYHLFHCTYMWKKMHRALVKRAPLDTYILDEEHTAHCGHMLLDRNPMLDQRNTIIVTKYPSCDEH